jgi:hypothetical protein
MSAQLPPHVQVEIRRILDAAARRLLDDRLSRASDPVEPGVRESKREEAGRRAAPAARTRARRGNTRSGRKRQRA